MRSLSIFTFCFLLSVNAKKKEGDCVLEDQVHSNNSVWRDHPCRVCSCQNAVSVCDPVVCQDPGCSTRRGGRLVLDTNSCCPSCMSEKSTCHYNGNTYMDASVWNPDPCVQCRCTSGDVKCSNISCPVSLCADGQVAQHVPDTCCPKCVNSGRECLYDGQAHIDGSIWQPLPCVQCLCKDGQSVCYTAQCPPLDCHQNDTAHITDGQCCPQCRATECKDDRVSYRDGDSWHTTNCTQCMCRLGKSVCQPIECEPCQPHQRPLKQGDRCCPLCISTDSVCYHGGGTYYHGQMWSTASCEYCSCDRGEVHCHTVTCVNTPCNENEILTHKDGRCCPQCMPLKMCDVNGSLVKPGDSWQPDDCTLCLCDGGVINCYSSCTTGSVKHVQSCSSGTCKSATCSSQCVQCSTHHVCEKCKRGYMLHKGECVDSCPAGFYVDLFHVCQACHKSCSQCSDRSPLSCTACPTHLMWTNGQCLSQCPEGYYSKGRVCIKCSRDCEQCDDRGNCIKCRRLGKLLHHGKCVDRCPSKYFTRFGHCSGCGKHCLSCYVDKPMCTSCVSGYVFLNGACADSCPKGYYRTPSNICTACHPSCSACNGAGDHKCTSCHGRARLHNGACKYGCDVGKYLDHNGFCQDCDHSCRQCYPSVNKTNSCAKCSQSTWSAAGPKCVNRCPAGTFGKDGICQPCQSHCSSCSSISQCTSCHSNQLFLYGECVDDCGPARWPDWKSGKCQDCPSGCLQCDGSLCQACTSGFYLRPSGLCSKKCGKGFIPNQILGVCDVNKVKPYLKFPHTLRLRVGDTAVLNKSLFSVTNTKKEHIVFKVVKYPATGRFLSLSEGTVDERTLVSFQDLDENKIRFLAQSAGKDVAQIKLYKGDHHSNVADLHLDVTSASPPSVLCNQKQMINSGETLPLNKLVTSSSANQQSLNFTVLHGSKLGGISHLKSKNVVFFTHKQLVDGEVHYTHHGSSTGTDHLLMQATDGHYTVNVLCDIVVKDKKDNTLQPVMVTNTGTEVQMGGMVRITSHMLKATSKHSPRLIYTLSPLTNNPAHGELLMVVPTPSTGRIRGWEDLGDNLMASRMYRFLQRDVDEGRMWYRHFKGSTMLQDSVQFQISDTDSPPNVLKDQTFNIGVVKPQSDQAAPTVAPGVRLGMIVQENQLVPITADDLAYTDIDTEDRDIVYTITRRLSSDQGTIELAEQPFQPTRRFTQEDINQNRVIYRPPAVELGARQKEFSFYFYVSDRASGESLPEQKFTIVVKPVNNMPPIVSSGKGQLEVMQSGITPIGQVLSVSDPDTSTDDLHITLVDSPAAGHVMKSVGGLRAVLRPGDRFTYNEVSKNVFFYQHDGSNRLSDTLQFMVDDGTNKVDIKVPVQVTRMDQQAPSLVQGSTLTVEVKEGESTQISRRHLAFVDRDASDDQVIYTVVSSLIYGELHREKTGVLTTGSRFTQQDVDNDVISYVSTGEIGSQDVVEQISFNVSDPSGNTIPQQILSVVVQPVNNQAPMATVGGGIQVPEGGVQVLSPADINVMDIDTPLRLLTVVIQDLPKFGVVENTKPAVGSEKQLSQRVTSFPVQDLNKGYIQYSQTNHQYKEPTADGFLFHINDGTNQSPTHRFNISILLTNDEPPTLVTEQVFVHESRGVALTNATLYVTDFDTSPDDLVLTVIKTPRQGSVRRLDFPQAMKTTGMFLRAGDTFSYEDVVNELIVYTHEGLEVSSDEFTLSVTDGLFNDTKTVAVRIGLVNDETPRIDVNHGLTVKAGTVTKLDSSVLRASDVDSDDSILIFTITQNPAFGEIRLYDGGGRGTLKAEGPVNQFEEKDIIQDIMFIQDELTQGNIEYVHRLGEPTGVTFFKFKVADSDGNMAIGQTFTITVIDDHIPPKVLANKPLSVTEGSAARLTTDHLSAADDDSEPAGLRFILLTVPDKGHLELVNNPGVPVAEFSQADLAANVVQYVHSSEEEVYMDSFTFSVTDGSNEITQTFHINISPVNDVLPVVTYKGLSVQEGVRKIITEFELKAEDLDTKEDEIIFQIVRPPSHGVVQLVDGDTFTPVTYFKMSDIYNNRVSYMHDGSETLEDTFDFLVSDGAHSSCMVIKDGVQVASAQPMLFKISVQPVDDGAPIMEVNLGLHYLEYVNGQAMNVITKRELTATDPDTPDDLLTYRVTKHPSHGRLERTDRPGRAVTTFTQDDVNNAVIRYVLTAKDHNIATDAFIFTLADSKPNIVQGLTFYITWTVISFEKTIHNVTEKAGLISIPVKRTGNLKQYAVVECVTKPGSATSFGGDSRPGQRDYVHHSGQVQFDEWQTTKACTIVINDDSLFEGPESFTVTLSQPAYALLGDVQTAQVTIFDVEDEPVLQFAEAMYLINETAGYVRVPIVRSGDISTSVSVMCLTKSLTAKGSSGPTLQSGSDYKTRPASHRSRVVLAPGITQADCVVQIVDDSLFEPSEQFEILLKDPSPMSRVGPLSQAIVVIEGPNDESAFYFSQNTYHVDEDSGTVELPVVRRGSDLSSTSMVWCATRMTEPPSATPGQDYVPSSKQITFEPGQLIKNCELTIVDDEVEPRLEGNETLTVFLTSPMGGVLSRPNTASVIINDTNLDLTTMQFEFDKYVVDEEDGHIDVAVVRHGDLSYESSVICYTRQDTAHVMMDYDERPLTDASRIVFMPGEKVKMCRVNIVNDNDAEGEEKFFLRLGHPLGTQDCPAQLGSLDTTIITIVNPTDTPTISISQSEYSVSEPSSQGSTSVVVVKVLRTGDLSGASQVRCSTRDGSAMSGLDYNAKSEVLKFQSGVKELDFEVEILSNQETEWHETFNIQLGPSPPVNAVLGRVSIATITILDQQVSGSLVLPASPIVVSLLDYDYVQEDVDRQPSPGYPVVCVTPCDPHFPTYLATRQLCEESGINQSSIQYGWEIATPTDDDGARSPFETVTDDTLFSSTSHMVLESFYFRPGFNVRCLAQPVDSSGNLGIPLRSTAVQIGSANGLCRAPITAGSPHGLQAQSFVANLKYVTPDDELHPNTVKISIQVPHQDGMLPLISTLPLHNLNFLLAEPIYRQQHVCSNIITPKERSGIINSGFLDRVTSAEIPIGAGYDKPYQFDDTVREARAINLYKHLNLKSCIWTFNAWYHMSDLIDICGGSVESTFKVRDAGRTYLTVSVPLHVSYVYALAPTGWAAMEHRSEMKFSFFYDTILWKSGLETEGKLSGKLQIVKIAIREDGRLQIDFKTHTKFRGQYVKTHYTQPNYESRVVPPDGVGVSFDLTLLWSQSTFDSPEQLWRAESKYNLKDYSGEYVIELVPCSVSPTQSYQHVETLACSAHQPERFVVPVGFQQTNRPVPLEYSLNTYLQVQGHKKMFLAPPDSNSLDDLDYQGTFSLGQTVFGRVLWNPAQSLKTAYKLRIEKVYVCTGNDGYVPTYDPTGSLYSEGPQFGCLQPSGRLKHRFLILDRGSPSSATRSFHGVNFNAQLVNDNKDYVSLQEMPGVDGFSFSVDPLFKVESGHQWYIQVLYIIGPADSLHSYQLQGPRVKRDVVNSLDDSLITGQWLDSKVSRNGTNIKFIELDLKEVSTQVKSGESKQEKLNLVAIVAPSVVGFVVLVSVIVGAVLYVKLQRIKSQNNAQPNSSNTTSCENNSKADNLGNFYAELRKQNTTSLKNVNSANLSSSYSNVKFSSKSGTKQSKLHIVHNELNDLGTEV